MRLILFEFERTAKTPRAAAVIRTIMPSQFVKTTFTKTKIPMIMIFNFT